MQYLPVFIFTTKMCLKKKTIVERSIAKKVKLRREKIVEIKEEEKNINNKLLK